MVVNLENYFAALDKTDDPWANAECRENDPELWWGWDERYTGGLPANEIVNDTAMALTICNRCPMKYECLEMGMTDQHLIHGIWGGLFAGERIGIKRKGTRITAELRAIEKARKFRKLSQVSIERENTEWAS